MHTSVKNLLLDLARRDWADNKVARILAFHYEEMVSNNDKKSIFEALIQYYKSSPSDSFDFNNSASVSEDESEGVSSFEGKDYRIKFVEVANVRGIPPEENNIPYGIDLSDNDSINNAIILASNGTGKSSIFSALEMIYAQEIGERKLRFNDQKSLTKAHYNNYLLRYTGTSSEPRCTVTTQDGVYSLSVPIFSDERIKKLLRPSNYFISDFDIYNYGQRDFSEYSDGSQSFHALIADALGLGEFLEFQQLLKQTSLYRRNTETRNLNVLEKRRSELEKSVINCESQVAVKRKELDQLRSTESQQIDQAGNHSVIETRKSWKPREIWFNFEENFFDQDVNFYLDLYARAQFARQGEADVDQREFLEIGLRIFEHFDNCPFCQTSTLSNDEIRQKVGKRVDTLNASRKLDLELRNSFDRVVAGVNQFYSEIDKFYQHLVNERNEIVSISQLRNLSKEMELLYVILSPVSNNTRIVDVFHDLHRNQSVSERNLKLLHDILTHSSFVQNKQLTIRIKSFISTRQSLLREFHSKEANYNDALISIKQRIAVAESDLKRLEARIVSDTSQIKLFKQQMDSIREETRLVETIQKHLSVFLPAFDVEVDRLISNLFDPVKQTAQSVLNDYMKDDKLRIRIEKIERKNYLDGQEVVGHLLTAKLELEQSAGKFVTVLPDIYFNTFRYKLFSLVIGLSVAIASRKKYRVNFPLVIDDIFFGADFVSKNSFSIFLQKIIRVFQNATPDMPLQFILLTHDDLIFRSAIDGIESYAARNLEEAETSGSVHSLSSKTILARLFKASDRDTLPHAFSSGQLYWNLLYQVPKSTNVQSVKI